MLCALPSLQVREEAGELCQTLEANEGQERAASEMADLLYHAMVLLNVQVGGWGWWWALDVLLVAWHACGFADYCSA